MSAIDFIEAGVTCWAHENFKVSPSDFYKIKQWVVIEICGFNSLGGGGDGGRGREREGNSQVKMLGMLNGKSELHVNPWERPIFS